MSEFVSSSALAKEHRLTADWNARPAGEALRRLGYPPCSNYCRSIPTGHASQNSGGLGHNIQLFERTAGTRGRRARQQVRTMEYLGHGT